MALTATTDPRAETLPPGKRTTTFFDDDLPGFGLRVRTTGAQDLDRAVRHRRQNPPHGVRFAGRARPGKARKTAKDLLAQVRLGRDPAGEKARGRAKTAETVGALLPRFLERQRARLKPRSYRRSRAASAGPCQAAARPDRRGHRPPQHRDPPGRDRRGERTGCRQPGAHALSAFFMWATREGYVESQSGRLHQQGVENGARDGC